MLNKAYNDKYIEEKLAPNMNIPIIVHMSTFNNKLIEETFQENIKVIYTFRDPLFLIETYSSYIDRIGNDPREFTPKISTKNVDLPWYSSGWEEEYIKINNTEKSILIIEKCFEFVSDKIDKLFDENIYKLIFFENITLNTDKVFFELVDFLGLTYNKETYKKIKNQK